MARIKNFLHRYKWWVLAGSSVIVFSLISLLALVIVLAEDSLPKTETHVQIPSTHPSPQPEIIDTSIPFQETVQEPNPPTEVKMTAPQKKQLAFVQRVIDGDSIEVIMDGEVYELRYIGIDAPESGMPFFNDATKANKSFVENQIVELESDISDTDQFGRLLRYVYLQDGSLVNRELVGLGLAAANAYPPDIKYQEALDSTEKTAIDAGIGLWAPTIEPTLPPTIEPTMLPTIEPTMLPTMPPPIGLDIEPEINIQVDPSCSQFNAPGNDNNNKNEEYVCVVNNGSGIVALLGWSLHDEYGWAYQFPVFNIEGNSLVRVFTGCGEDSSQELFWCKDETAVWNNDGDCVYLVNAEGIETAKYCY